MLETNRSLSDNSRSMPSKAKKSGFSFILALAACIIGIVALILVSLWATKPKDSNDWSYLGAPTTLIGYPGSENVFAWHPVLMVGGFFVGQVLAINTWSIIPDHVSGKILHVLWQLAALACMIAGLTAVVKYKFNSKDPSLTSMHSWIGICGIVMYGMNFVIALLPESIDWLAIHRFCGLAAIAISTSAISTGIMELFGQYGCFYNNYYNNYYDDDVTKRADNNPAQHYHDIPGGCKIANGLGIAVLISVLLTIAAVLARNKAIEENNNSSLVSPVDIPIATIVNN